LLLLLLLIDTTHFIQQTSYARTRFDAIVQVVVEQENMRRKE
jgi:hypothetical protein